MKNHNVLGHLIDRQITSRNACSFCLQLTIRVLMRELKVMSNLATKRRFVTPEHKIVSKLLESRMTESFQNRNETL